MVQDAAPQQKQTILVVDDNDDILTLMRLVLTKQGYNVLTAPNGMVALGMLNDEASPLPDLIICDIMMPEMDGYNFFNAIVDQPRLNLIPFLFLTALSSPSDVRFGKMLGADDYITKPFEKEDLLAVIEGKLNRKKKIVEFSEKIDKFLATIKLPGRPSLKEAERDSAILLVVFWDDKEGPVIRHSHFEGGHVLAISLKELGNQLFNSVVSIYGYENISSAQDILLSIDNINRMGYIYFDSYVDPTTRAGERQYMIGVISPRINYFESLKLNRVFKIISGDIKLKGKIDVKGYWEEISVLLTSPVF